LGFLGGWRLGLVGDRRLCRHGGGDDSKQQRAEGDLIAVTKLAFLDSPTVDPDPVATAQVSNHNAIVRQRETTVASGHLR
jgi:hypothetical protein